MTEEERTSPAEQLIDWRRLGRRLGLSAVVMFTLALVAWMGSGWLGSGLDTGDLPGFVGLAFGGMFLAELVFVGGSALRGLLRAGERGERLAGGDVGILPPQVRRRRRGGSEDQ